MHRFSRGLAAFAACAVLSSGAAFALEAKPLDALIAEGTRLWEYAAPYARLGKSPALSTIDPGPVLRRLASEFASAKRYDEFAYLIEYVEREMAAKRLDVRVVADAPPIPGFWPARVDGARRAIAINEDSLASMSIGDPLYRSSFLRAAASLYYTDSVPSVSGALGGRNAATELSAFMSGIWVESIYLLEILKLDEPEGPALDYFGILFSSARNDELRGIASTLFRVDLNMAYEAIQIVRKKATKKEALRFVDNAARFMETLADDIESSTMRSTPTMADIERGSKARAALIALPWTARTLSRGPDGKDPAMDKALSGLVASLTNLSSAYARLDPLVMSDSIRNLNGFRFSEPDPEAPKPAPSAVSVYDALAPGPDRKGVAPQPFPGAVADEWFRFCEPVNAYEVRGELPVSAEEALAGAAFRFSYGEGGAKLAVEWFVYGMPRESDALQWAARIRAGSDGSGRYLVWENALGSPMLNDSGFAYMRKRPDGGNVAYSFYAPDGRRVRDCSGAWAATVAPAEGGYDIRYENAAGAPYAGAYGYAVDSRRFGPSGEEIRTHFDERGRPARSLVLGYHSSSSAKAVGDDSVVISIDFLDEDGGPATVAGGYSSERISISAESRTYELLLADGGPASSGMGWSTERIAWKSGLVERLGFYAADGGPAVSAEGFHEARYTLGADGNPLEVAFFGAAGEPVVSSDGFHSRTNEYDGYGSLVEVRFFGLDGKPASDSTGAARIRWTKDESGATVDVGVWDANGGQLAGTPSEAL